jgi:hypothetical protein
MIRRFLITFAVLTGMHAVLTVMTLAIGTTLELSDFDTGPTARGAVGGAIMAVHDILELPFRPLDRQASPWSVGRGYVGVTINSTFCGFVVAACVALLRPRRVRTNAAG